MQAFIKFNKGMMQMPTPVRLWLLVLVMVNLVIPLFFLNRIEAQIVLAAFLASMMLMTGLTALSGFSRLVGLGHIIWIPMLVWLWIRLDQIPGQDFFGIWVRLLMILDGISLVLDAVDVSRYIGGDRREVVQGLE